MRHAASQVDIVSIEAEPVLAVDVLGHDIREGEYILNEFLSADDFSMIRDYLFVPKFLRTSDNRRSELRYHYKNSNGSSSSLTASLQ